MIRWLLTLLTILCVLAPYPASAFTQSRGYLKSSSQWDSASDSASLDVTGDMTLEGWFKLTTFPAGDVTSSMMGKWVDTGSQDSYLIQVRRVSGVFSIRMLNTNDGSSVGLASVNFLSSPSFNTWYHFAVVFTASTHTMEFFLNGVSQGTAAGTLKTSTFSGSGQFTIAADNSATFLDGRAFLLRVWSATRTSSQISTNWCTALGATTNLKAEWTLDNVLTDNSGNSNTLTGHGTPTFSADIPSTCSGGGGGTTLPTFYRTSWF